MGTRAIVVLLVGLTLVFVPLAEAQQTKKVPRIGYLSSFDPAAESTRSEPFRRALSERGYIEGQNIAIDYRYAEGKVDRFPELAAELARLKVEIIVVSGGPTVRQRTGILFFYPFTVGTTSEKKTASQKNFTQNLAGHQMPWHVDNKQTLPDSTEKMLDYKGLITLIYLDDIDPALFSLYAGLICGLPPFIRKCGMM
jgi:hypothetical protein